MSNSTSLLIKALNSSNRSMHQTGYQQCPWAASPPAAKWDKIDVFSLVFVQNPLVLLRKPRTPVAELIRIIAFLTVFHASIEIDCYCSFFRYIESTNYTVMFLLVTGQGRYSQCFFHNCLQVMDV